MTQLYAMMRHLKLVCQYCHNKWIISLDFYCQPGVRKYISQIDRPARHRQLSYSPEMAVQSALILLRLFGYLYNLYAITLFISFRFQKTRNSREML